ncbi:hypothetical protein SAMN02745823_03561 [Sporobacter termitidis DSM 10068]|uniref:Catalase n=1 Tax=Sporobacter termitidis DSM 10068 TaxID=1123282 RepID=A0A1M5ZDU2_9FIRM|nr:DUF5662 family protein [Sporobacter termitidis]SHI22173.1 hypothetical protein SAMN02745823_03561 [Sporobacter termitidis DSM 10068]
MKWLSHLKTINHHKRLVMHYCFRVGLYRQGLTHDLSKYTPVEFIAGARYYQGFQSPNNMERKVRGYSAAWLHHKGRNKHHLEYWIDYASGEPSGLAGMEMPVRYVVEMFCDRLAASRTYRREQYRDGDPYDYYMRSRDAYVMHPNTRALLERLLIMLRDKGEEETLAFISREVLHRAKRV